MSVLIVARPEDDHAAPVAAELRRRGEVVHFLDVASIPQRQRVSVEVDSRGWCAWLHGAGEPVDLVEIKTVWLRRFGAPDPVIVGEDRWWAISENHQLLIGLAQALSDCRWVNPLASLAMDSGWGKAKQLKAAHAVGLEVPRTLMTSSPKEAREFASLCPAGVIYKPFASRELVCPDGVKRALYTTALEAGTDFSSIAHAPGIFQERVPKALEVRATVMGERVFAISIDSQAIPESQVDYRKKYLEAAHAVLELPAEVERKLVALHRELGLVFGTADLIIRPDGGYTFLETNQQGLWLWCAKKTGLDLVSPFADLLLGG